MTPAGQPGPGHAESVGAARAAEEGGSGVCGRCGGALPVPAPPPLPTLPPPPPPTHPRPQSLAVATLATGHCQAPRPLWLTAAALSSGSPWSIHQRLPCRVLRPHSAALRHRGAGAGGPRPVLSAGLWPDQDQCQPAEASGDKESQVGHLPHCAWQGHPCPGDRRRIPKWTGQTKGPPRRHQATVL